jgi:hypothetical protein
MTSITDLPAAARSATTGSKDTTVNNAITGKEGTAVNGEDDKRR